MDIIDFFSVNTLMMAILALSFLSLFMFLCFIIFIGVKFVNEITIKHVKTCRYSPLTDGLYKTSCGQKFHDSSDTGAPVTDWVSYCPYCGGSVIDN